MKKLVVLASLWIGLSHPVFADGIGDIPSLDRELNSKLSCRVIVIAEGASGTTEGAFELPLQGAPHGGDGKELLFGPNKVTLTADAQWMTLTWERDGKTVAAGLFVYRGEVVQNRVVILYDPSNLYDRVSFDCDVIPGASN